MPTIELAVQRGMDVYRPDTGKMCGTLPYAVRNGLMRSLPDLLLENRQSLGLSPELTRRDIAVEYREFGETWNCPSLRMVVTFEGEVPPVFSTRHRVTSKMMALVIEWFMEANYQCPTDVAVEIDWREGIRMRSDYQGLALPA